MLHAVANETRASTVKNERSFQPFLGYLSCFCSCFCNSSHSPYNYTQLMMSHSKDPPVWFLHYFGRGLKAFIIMNGSHTTIANTITLHVELPHVLYITLAQIPKLLLVLHI